VHEASGDSGAVKAAVRHWEADKSVGRWPAGRGTVCDALANEDSLQAAMQPADALLPSVAGTGKSERQQHPIAQTRTSSKGEVYAWVLQHDRILCASMQEP
jgi:hypothetical protein